MSGAATAAPPETAESATEAHRSFRLGVWNGALHQGGEGFFDASTVIPVFLARITTSNALIGLGSALGDVGWLLPQFLVAPRMIRRRRLLPPYRHAAIVRGGALALLAALIWVLRDQPRHLLVTFFLCYGAYCFAAGYAALSFMEVVGRTVPRERLGGFFAARLFWGGSLAAAAGLIVREVLKLPDAALRFGILFGVGAVFVSVAYALFATIREPDVPPAADPGTPLELLGEGVRLLREDAPFRNLFLARAALAAWLTVSPFMVLFAVRDLRGGGTAAGTFLFARVAGFVLANLAWHRLSEREGNRGVMRVAALGCAAVALGAALVAALSPWWLGVLPRGAAVLLLEGLAALGGASQSGLLVGYGSLVLELAPEGRRQVFVSLMNTFLAPMMLLPALGGALVDALNAPLMFALCALIALLGWRAANDLPAGGRIERAAAGVGAAGA